MGNSLKCPLLVLFCFFPQFYFSMNSSQNMELVQELIFDEISALKKKIWVDISAEIRQMSKTIDVHSSELKTCECTPLKMRNNQDQDENMLHSDFVRLLKGYEEEKAISRVTEKRLDEALLVIKHLENEFGKLTKKTQKLEDEANKYAKGLKNTADNLTDVDSSIINLQAADETLRKDLDSVNSACLDMKRTMDTGFRSPSFVSEWMLMRAQDQDKVQRVVEHGIGELPYKVEVQIRPTTGPNAGWIFHGDAAFQSDDDIGEAYGGIVYFYNETHVILTAPIKANGQTSGVLINTGNSSFRRIGNNHQMAMEAYVRIKVWASSDFPPPDYKSVWLPLDISNSSLSYYELKHGLSGYPRFINVQIRCNGSNRNMVSEGLGATMMHRRWANGGGVVYAFNDKSVRLWTGVLESIEGNSQYRLLGSSDGWGGGSINGNYIKKGEFRILTWGHYGHQHPDTEERSEQNIVFPEWFAFDNISPDTDLLSFYVEATDGANKGYRFKGYGNSQAIDSPFGGVVYAFSPEGNLRTWRPNATSNGYLVHVHSPYGNGKNSQASNNGQYVSTLIRTSAPV